MTLSCTCVLISSPFTYFETFSWQFLTITNYFCATILSYGFNTIIFFRNTYSFIIFPLQIIYISVILFSCSLQCSNIIVLVLSGPSFLFFSQTFPQNSRPGKYNTEIHNIEVASWHITSRRKAPIFQRSRDLLIWGNPSSAQKCFPLRIICKYILFCSTINVKYIT